MKRFVALILCFSLLCVGCAKVGEKRKNISVEQTTVPSVEFRDISNPKLLDYVEENVYASLLNKLIIGNILLKTLKLFIFHKSI